MTTSTPSMPAKRIRLGFLDGIRGLAALYVLLFHALTIEVNRADQSLSAPMQILRTVFGYGHFGVSVFIVLSGFSLMLPIARSGVLRLDRGFAGYLRRRSRRILPAYYAALALSIASIVGARIVFGEAGNDAALSPGSVISHLLLVHTFTADWAFRINGPMWSVATEWHIYFLLPLVLLPLWRRFGAAATVTLAWAAPLALHLFVSDEWNFWWAAPWFVGSFAIGMLGAVMSHTGGPELRLPWGTIGLASLALLVALLAIPETTVPLIYLDFVVSVMSMGLIMLCVRQVITAASATSLLDIEREPKRASWLTGFLGSAPLLSLGAFSYSLYLLQHPLLRFTEAILDRTSLGFEAVLWVQLIISVPIIMVVSRIFAEFFEMPFTSGSPIVDRLGQRFPLPTARGRAMSMSGASGGPPDQPPSGSAT